MRRLEEVEAFAAVQSEPTRSEIRGLVAGLGRGVFQPGRALDLARRRPMLRWVAFLLALETAELRLGGSVELESPPRRRALHVLAPLEEWGPFRCRVWPGGERAVLELEADRGGYAVAIREGEASEAVVHAVCVLAREVATHLGVAVRVAA